MQVMQRAGSVDTLLTVWREDSYIYREHSVRSDVRWHFLPLAVGLMLLLSFYFNMLSFGEKHCVFLNLVFSPITMWKTLFLTLYT